MAKVTAKDTKPDNGNLKSSSSSITTNTNSQNSYSNSHSSDATAVVKFTLSVQKVFKRSPSPGSPLSVALRRSSQHVTLVVDVQDLECRCPKIRVNK